MSRFSIRPGSLLSAGVATWFAMAAGLGLLVTAAPSGALARGGAPWHIEKRDGAPERTNLVERELAHHTRRFGPAVLSISVDGQVVFNATFKGASSRDTFQIASGSKWLTAAAVMRLVEEGVLSLDDGVGDYLPFFKNKKGSITVRQLLSHTSGLSEVQYPEHGVGGCAGEYLMQVAQAPLSADPGTVFRYGNTSYRVVRRVAEIAAGESWEEIFRSRIAAPLGMRETGFRGAAVSSAEDYLRFLEAFRASRDGAPGALLSEESVREMTRDQTRNATMSGGGRIRRQNHQGDRYGLGVWLDGAANSGDEPRVISHHGSSGFRAFINFEEGTSGVFLTKRKPRTKRWLRRRLESVLAIAEALRPRGASENATEGVNTVRRTVW